MFLIILCISRDKDSYGLHEYFQLEPENCLSNTDGKMLDPLLLRIKLSKHVIFFQRNFKKY